MSLRDGYATIRDKELWLINVHISPYRQANHENHEPRRERKLLLHRREINRLITSLQEKGLTLIPLKVFLKDSWAKVELGLARGKKKFDKRAALRQEDDEKRMRRAMSKQYKIRF